jgi:hypothetical protein
MTDAGYDHLRGTGRTTRLMLSAPNGALFVCHDHHFANDYARRLARHLGREDLKITHLDALDRFRGMNIRAIRIDHACERMTERQWKTFIALYQDHRYRLTA